ncbi:MAG: bifunctional hydroxymethylpyrimidine kinase/phosphomethylpyrimidine kinase, partial [Candidatus Altiarchaeales archaeon]|nr:bifunctional hydroxymethylpyrimidine kinase/phosphomethylpyrimidine kinase [Candidatus Altiarchaeales archaeon]
RLYEFPSRVKVKARLHGAGCAFSAAVAACLAGGDDVLAAVGKTKKFIDSCIARNLAVGEGSRIIDVSGLKLGETVEDVEKRKIIEDIEKAVNRFISYVDSYRLVPEVGVNIAVALPDARERGEVAGISGRLVRDRQRVVPVGVIEFGGTSHVGRIILTVMKFDPEKRAALNMRFSEDMVEAARNSGFSMSSFDRKLEPEDVRTMEWGTLEAIKSFGGVPDVIYDGGGVSKEAMIRILGTSAIEVVDKAIKIGKNL